MDQPGCSIFQGAESLKLSDSLERAQEEEELEDQRRRERELGDLLQNAFDDLEDDDTVDSTTNFHTEDILPSNIEHIMRQPSPEFLPPPPAPLGAVRNLREDYDSEIHRLNMLLESRTHELENIKRMANDEYKARDELQKHLTITAAELDRALASKKNTHELLVESKEKCSNLESTIAKLRNEKKTLESEHNEVLGQLETAQTLLADVQTKYNMVERDFNRQNDRNAEMRRKQADERHRAEMDMIQQQVEQLTDKLDKKTNECENINTRYRALQQTHEVMLLDKGTKINELSFALSDAQKKCEELLGKEDYFQENIKLQKLVASLQAQIKAMEKTIESLNERLEFTTAELDVMDSVLHQHNTEDTPRRLSQTQGKLVGSTPLGTVDRIGNLKDELYRALNNVKAKREEVNRLQKIVDEKNAEIHFLKQEENNALVQISTLKEDKVRLENRLKVLQEEYNEQRLNRLGHSSEQIENLSKEMKRIVEEKINLEQLKKELERERDMYQTECKKLELRLKNVEMDLEELKQEHESVKLNYDQVLKDYEDLRQNNSTDSNRLDLEKHKILLKDAQMECDRLKSLYVDITNAKEALTYEIQKIRNMDSVKELYEERERVANLQRTLQLTQMKNSEITKVMENEKLCHEREINELREKFDRELVAKLKASKEISNNCTKCIDYMAEITKFEIQNFKLNNINSMSKKEIDDLTRQLNESKELIAELNEKIKLCDNQEQLIKELKAKAQTFEEYIKSQSSASEKSATPPKRHSSENKSTAAVSDLDRSEVKKIEARIREEMAKIFANELKRFQVLLRQNEEKTACLQQEYQHVSNELQQRQVEVEKLKQAILAEREKIEELLSEKDVQCERKLQKLNALLMKCREVLKIRNEKIVELVKELEERQVQIEAERKSMKAVMSQWEEQRKNADAIETEWKGKLHELKKSHESASELWQTKYNSAKRTAANYKRYAEDKEAHMLREYERLKFEYDESLVKIEISMRQALEVKNRELKDAMTVTEKKRQSSSDKENKASN